MHVDNSAAIAFFIGFVSFYQAVAEQPAEEDLVSLAQAEGELVVYGSCEEEYLAAACQNFEKLYGIKTTYQRLSTGEVQAKIEEENGNPSADVWFGGTTDPYNVVAGEGLLEAYEAENASHLLSDMYRAGSAAGSAAGASVAAGALLPHAHRDRTITSASSSARYFFMCFPPLDLF